MIEPDIQPPAAVTFRADAAKLPKVPGFLSWALAILLGLLFGVAPSYLYRFDSLAGYWAAEWDYIVWAGCLGVTVMVAVMAHMALLAHPRFISRIFLHLDSEGLTQSYRFKTRRWAWRELPPFVFEANELPPNIAFHWPGQKPDSLRKGEITNLYDAPLAEIAAKLKEYRERALAEAS